MAWAKWTDTVITALACAGLAWGQPSTSQAPVARDGSQPLLTVQEFGGQPQQSRVLKLWRQPNGMMAYEVQEIATGERMTIVETRRKAGVGSNLQAAVTRIFRWGQRLTPPPGTPTPPTEVVEQPVKPQAVTVNAPPADKIEPAQTSDWRQSWGKAQDHTTKLAPRVDPPQCDISRADPLKNPASYAPIPAEAKTNGQMDGHGLQQNKKAKAQALEPAALAAGWPGPAPAVGQSVPPGSAPKELPTVPGPYSPLNLSRGVGPVTLPKDEPPGNAFTHFEPVNTPPADSVVGGGANAFAPAQPAAANPQPRAGACPYGQPYAGQPQVAAMYPPTPYMPPWAGNYAAPAWNAMTYQAAAYGYPVWGHSVPMPVPEQPSLWRTGQTAMASAYRGGGPRPTTLPDHLPPSASGPHSLDSLLATLHDALLPSERAWAADALASKGEHAPSRALDALLETGRRDPSAMVRATCAHCLAKMAPDNASVRNTLQALQADSNPLVRQEADQSLARLGVRPAQSEKNAVQPASATMPADSR